MVATIDHAELKRVAEAAEAEKRCRHDLVDSGCPDNRFRWTATPGAVLALLDENERLRSYCEELLARFGAWPIEDNGPLEFSVSGTLPLLLEVAIAAGADWIKSQTDRMVKDVGEMGEIHVYSGPRPETPPED